MKKGATLPVTKTYSEIVLWPNTRKPTPSEKNHTAWKTIEKVRGKTGGVAVVRRDWVPQSPVSIPEWDKGGLGGLTALGSTEPAAWIPATAGACVSEQPWH